jgi:hypothetical protein
MLIIIGVRRVRRNLGAVFLVCDRCGEPRRLAVRIRSYLAVFFIPVIPLGTRYVTVCPNCRAQRDVSRAEVEGSGPPTPAVPGPAWAPPAPAPPGTAALPPFVPGPGVRGPLPPPPPSPSVN